MALRLKDPTPQPDDIEIRMTSPHVSDSEDELDTVTLSSQKLHSILRSRLRKNHTFIPRKSGILSLNISRSVDDAFSKSVESTRTVENNESALSSFTNNIQADRVRNFDASDSFNTIQELRRSSRRRNVSFYQQHIYTIDSVSYTLRISLEDATELVKQRPEIIKMYHLGKLEKYLKNGFKLEEPKKSQPSYDSESKSGFSKIADSSDESDNFGHSDRSSSNSDSGASDDDDDDDDDDNSESDNDDEIQSREASFSFRGRVYRNLDAVSKASGLPKSFFSRKKTAASKPIMRKRETVAQSLGVAKRKKIAAAPVERHLDESVFTTSSDARDVRTISSPVSYHDNFEVPDNDEVVDVQQYNIYDREHPDSVTASGDDAYGLAAEYDGRYLDDYDQTDDEPFEVEQHHQSDDDIMFLGQREIQDFSRMEKSKALASHSRSRTNMFENNHDYARPSFSSSEGGLIDAMLSRSGHSIPATKLDKRDSQQKTFGGSRKHRLEVIRKDTMPLGLKKRQAEPGRRRRKGRTRQLKRVSKIQVLSNIDHNSMVGQERKHKKALGNVVKKPRKTSLWVNSAISNYRSSASTIIFEGLASKQSPVDSIRRALPSNEDVMVGNINNTEVDLPDVSKWSFKKSLSYKLLFAAEKVEVIPNVTFMFSGRTITFPSYTPDHTEQINFFFKSLLDSQNTKIPSSLFEKIDSVILFCSRLSVDEIRSLVTIVDDFVLRIESNVRQKGQVKDLDFFLLSCSMLFYHLCSFVFIQNHIRGYDLNSKLLVVMKFYIEVLCYISGTSITQKVKDSGLFLQSLIIASQSSTEIFELAFGRAKIPDMKFLLALCQLHRFSSPSWTPVTKLLKQRLDSRSILEVRDEIKNIEYIRSKYGWRLSEDLLIIIYELLKANKFGNYQNECSFPVIYTDSGLNKDTSLNIYLNMLVEYQKESKSLSGRFIEKITPVSKVTHMDIFSFCNRINILLCLAVISKKSFESRMDQIFLNTNVQDKNLLQQMIKALERMMKINSKNSLPCGLKSLTCIIEKCLHFNEIGQLKQALLSFDDQVLHLATRKNIISAIACFSRDPKVINAFSQFIKSFASRLSDRKDLEYLKKQFGDISSSNHAGLWCLINGKLVSNDLENWSRLIKFNDFEDEPFIYSYILRHSGTRIYQVERESFIIVLAKALTSFKSSGSLNSFIREIERIDPYLLPSKGILVQSHKFQFATSLISKIMTSETNYVKSRVMSSLFTHLKLELKFSNGSLQYCNFLTNIVQYIDKFAGDLPVNLEEFLKLKSLLAIGNSDKQDEESRRAPQITLTQRLLSLERLILTSHGDKIPLEAQKLFSKEHSQSINSPTDISSSQFYEICCLVSIHANLLQNLPCCWVLLARIIRSLSDTLEGSRTLTRVDLFCIFKMFKLFRFILKFKHSQFIRYRCITGINIYKILITMLKYIEGSNDMQVIYGIFFVFLSRDIIYHESRLDDEAGFIIKPPSGISEMIIKANIQDQYNANYDSEQKSFCDHFDDFCHKMNFREDLLQGNSKEDLEEELDYSVVEDLIN